MMESGSSIDVKSLYHVCKLKMRNIVYRVRNRLKKLPRDNEIGKDTLRGEWPSKKNIKINFDNDDKLADCFVGK